MIEISRLVSSFNLWSRIGSIAKWKLSTNIKNMSAMMEQYWSQALNADSTLEQSLTLKGEVWLYTWSPLGPMWLQQN